MDDCSRRLLEYLMNTESFDDVLIALAGITRAKAAKTYELKQWRKAGDRLVMLPD
jgi:hypothetical protein